MNHYNVTATTKQGEVIRFTMLAPSQKVAHLIVLDQFDIDTSIMIEGAKP